MPSHFFICLALITGISTTSLVAGYINPGDEVVCRPIDGRPKSCVCKSSSSNKIIDLSPLQNKTKNQPSFFAIGEEKGWSFAWSPCENFERFSHQILQPQLGEKACLDTGLAMYINTPRICWKFGSHENSSKLQISGIDTRSRLRLSQMFSYKLVNQGSEVQLNARIDFHCDEEGSTDSAKLLYDGKKSINKHQVYLFSFTSKCCCEGGCESQPKPTTGPTTGSTKPPDENWIIGGGISMFLVLIVGSVIVYKKYCHPPQPQPAPNRFPVPVEHNPENQEDEERIPILAG